MTTNPYDYDPDTEDLRMRAYYYSFNPTGVLALMWALAVEGSFAVACVAAWAGWRWAP